MNDVSTTIPKTSLQLFTENADDIVKKIRAEVTKHSPDITSDKGRKEIASLAYSVARSKNEIDKIGKDSVAGMKEQVKLVDKERARIWDDLEALQKEVRKPLTEFEEKETKRVQAHQDGLAAIDTILLFPTDLTLDYLTNANSSLEKHRAREWDEFEALAKAKCDGGLRIIKEKTAALLKAEEDRKELEKLRQADEERKREAAAKEQKEREERLQKEAAAQATKDAEEKAKKEAAAKDAEATAAIAKAQKAEQDAIAATARAEKEKEAAVQAERDRAAKAKLQEDAAQAKRESDKNFKRKIITEASHALLKSGLVKHEGESEAIIVMIDEGKIPHIKIIY